MISKNAMAGDCSNCCRDGGSQPVSSFFLFPIFFGVFFFSFFEDGEWGLGRVWSREGKHLGKKPREKLPRRPRLPRID